MSEERQVRYEKRRHERLLGLSIDQAIQAVRNIATFGDPKHWPVEDMTKWLYIREKAEDISTDLKELEEKLLLLADIYQPAIAPVVKDENATTNKD